MHEIKDGKVTLYQRDGKNDHWQFKFLRFGEKGAGSAYIRQTSKTSNLDEAKRIAAAAYEKAFNAHAQGLSAHVPTFGKYVPIFLADLKHDVAVGDCTQAAYVTTKTRLDQAMPFIGDKVMDTFSQDTIKQMHKDRLAAWVLDPRRHANGGLMNIKQPSKESQSKLEGAINRVLKHAKLGKKISVNPLDGMKRSGRADGKHGFFNPANWTRLSSHLTTACDTPRLDWRYSRRSLSAFVHTCRLAGLRVAECYSLQIGDVDLYPDVQVWESGVAVKKDVVTLRVFGEDGPDGKRLGNKNGNQRAINVTAELRPYLLLVMNQHPDRGNKKAPLWVKSGGERVVDYHHPFGDVLEELGMIRDDNGNKLVLGSLRHSFITEKLLANNLPQARIEAFCDTSAKQIKDHYNEVLQSITSTGVACSI